MVHIGALPGTPASREPIGAIAARAAEEAALLARAGFDAVLIENMHDAPYLARDVGPEIVAGMTTAGRAVRETVGDAFPLGVQVLAGANRAALAVALAIGAGFIRAEGFVFASVADEGLLASADAGPLLRYRRAIGAEHVAIYADIKKKHSSNAITGDVSLAETARAATFFRADGVIVTGSTTGAAADDADVREAKAACELPVLVGSGVTRDTVRQTLALADAIIVGSALKRDGDWRNPPDPARIEAFVEAARA